MRQRNLEAVRTALVLLKRPQLLRSSRCSPLPEGMTLLLEVAAGEPDAVREALTGVAISEALLAKAAGFFIEQVLLSRSNDSYRILGTTSGASASELRRHLALMLKWLHPDLALGNGQSTPLDKTALASLVTAAWDTIKTEDRRAAYDAALNDRSETAQREAPLFAREPSPAWNPPSKRQPRRLALYKIEREPFWARILLYLESLKHRK